MTHSLRTVLLCATLVTASAAATATSDPIALLALLGDSVGRSTAAAGGAVLTIVPARGRDLAVYGVVRTTAAPDRLVAWTRAIEQLYQGRYVPALGRFSDPPQLADLAGLTLDEEDLNDLRACRPGDCGVKLSAPEMERIRQAAAAGGAQWRPAVQDAFRRVVLGRAQDYLASGLAGSLPYEDHQKAVSPQAEFEEIAARIGFETLYDVRVVPYLRAYPAVRGRGGRIVSLLVKGNARRRQADCQRHACRHLQKPRRTRARRGRCRPPDLCHALPDGLAVADGGHFGRRRSPELSDLHPPFAH